MKKYFPAQQNKSEQGFTPTGFLLRVFFYSGFVVALFLPYIQPNYHDHSYAVARNNLGALTRAQQAHHFEHGKFAYSIAELSLKTGIKIKDENYDFQILSPMSPVETLKSQSTTPPDVDSVFLIAQPLPKFLEYHNNRIYIGADFYIKNLKQYATGICEIDAEQKTFSLSDLPTLTSDNKVQCPPGYRLR